jgi:FkbM family methyltransferase
MTTQLIRTYLHFLINFRNGAEMIRTLRGGPPCVQAVLWNGVRLNHPKDKDGLVSVLQELWIDRGFLPPGFYKPRPGDAVIDCGAHIGMFSILVARSYPNCKVTSFEPHPENYQFLASNIAAAGLKNVSIQRAAVGRERGFGFMSGDKNKRTLDYMLNQRTETSEKDERDVEIYTLADLFEAAKTDRIALLKVDVEGSENELFVDADQDILRRIDRIAMEYHDNLRPGTLDFLRQKFSPTHELTIKPSPSNDCGILLARLR